MKLVENVNILFVSKENIVLSSWYKPFEKIEITDLSIPKEKIRESEMIILRIDSKYKVLKSRY